MKWTDEKTTRLIELSEAHSILYDVQDKNYHNGIKKRVMTEKIAAELGVNGSQISSGLPVGLTCRKSVCCLPRQTVLKFINNSKCV
jgi:hypothetical protein